MVTICQYVVGTEYEGVTLARLFQNLSVYPSKIILYKLLRTGSIRVNGKRVKHSYLLKQGDVIRYPVFNIFQEDLGTDDKANDTGSLEIPVSGKSMCNVHIGNSTPSDLSTESQLPIHVTTGVSAKTSLHISRHASEYLAQKLLQSILYNDEGVLAINKPAGVPVQGGRGVKVSIDHALPYLNLQISKLQPYEPLKETIRFSSDKECKLNIPKACIELFRDPIVKPKEIGRAHV